MSWTHWAQGFQQARSLLAIGSGQVTGQGVPPGDPNPERLCLGPACPAHGFHLFRGGEELGLVGCLAILALLGAILLRCVWLTRRSRDPLFASVAMGGGGMFGAQTLLNVGMCLYVAPVVGVTLPFFSYGGSSLLMAFGAVGILAFHAPGRAGRKRQLAAGITGPERGDYGQGSKEVCPMTTSRFLRRLGFLMVLAALSVSMALLNPGPLRPRGGVGGGAPIAEAFSLTTYRDVAVSGTFFGWIPRGRP